MGDRQQFSIRFLDLELADAGVAARSLRAAILDASPDVEVRVQKDDPTTMDFGATLVATLGTASVIAVAHGISGWLRQKRHVVVIEGKDGSRTTFTGRGDITKEAVALVEALRRGA